MLRLISIYTIEYCKELTRLKKNECKESFQASSVHFPGEVLLGVRHRGHSVFS